MLRPARGMLRSQWDTSLRSAVHQAQALDVAAQVSCCHSVTVSLPTSPGQLEHGKG